MYATLLTMMAHIIPALRARVFTALSNGSSRRAREAGKERHDDLMTRTWILHTTEQENQPRLEFRKW